MSKFKSLLKGSSTIAIFTLISRIFGFIRDLLIARFFGAGFFTDVFFTAYKIPNILRSLAAEGALTSAFIPIYSDTLKESNNENQKFINSISLFMLIINFLICTLIFLNIETIISFFAPGFINNNEKFLLTIKLTKIMIPYLLFISLVSLTNSILSTHKIFSYQPKAQILMNIVTIIGIFLGSFFSKSEGIFILSYSILLGGAVQLCFAKGFLNKIKKNILPKLPLITNFTKKFFVLFIPACIGASVYQLSSFLNTILGSLLKEGSISWLFYADRIYNLPIGIITISLASTLLPFLAKAKTDNSLTEFNNQLSKTLSIALIILIPASLFIFFYSELIIKIIFLRGSFSYNDLIQTSLALKALAPGLVFASINTLCIRSIIALKDTKTPLILSLTQLFVGFSVALVLMGEFVSTNIISNYIQNYQIFLNSIFKFTNNLNLAHQGLAMSQSISSVFILPFIFLILKLKKIKLNFNIILKVLLLNLILISLFITIYNLLENYIYLSMITNIIMISFVLFLTVKKLK